MSPGQWPRHRRCPICLSGRHRVHSGHLLTREMGAGWRREGSVRRTCDEDAPVGEGDEKLALMHNHKTGMSIDLIRLGLLTEGAHFMA